MVFNRLILIILFLTATAHAYVDDFLTDDQLRASNIGVNASQIGTWNINSILNPVAVTGTFWQATQPVSLSAVPLATNASTLTEQQTQTARLASIDSTLALIKAKTDNIDVALSTRTKPADTQAVSGTVTANAGTNLNTSLLSLESGHLASIDTSIASINTKITDGSQKTQIVDSAGSSIASIDDGNSTKALEVALGATSFVFSSVNSTTAQLAAAATFAGAVESVVNQQSASILLTSDQNGSLVLREYIDAGGTRLSRTSTYSIIASVPFSRSFVINGNYFKASFTNNGGATTTTLNLNTAYGTIPSATALGNGQVSLDEVAGTALTNNSIRPDAVLKVAGDSTSLIYDAFDSTLDTTDRWSVSGTAPTSGTGLLTMNQGTTALAYSDLQSRASFPLLGNMFNHAIAIIQVDSGVKTGNYRFFGFGTAAGSPTVAIPITNGVGFGWDATTGNLSGDVWSNSVKTQTVSLTNFQKTDGALHRYAIYFKTSRVYFELDGINIGSIANPSPQISTLPMISIAVNGASTVSPAAVMASSFFGVGDTSRTNMFISDGVSPWRKATVKPQAAASASTDNELVVRSIEGAQNKASYSCATDSFTPAATATDMVTLIGSATKTIRVTKINFYSNQTTSGINNIWLIKRSTANTGGTSTTRTIAVRDSQNPATTTTCRLYSANPTLGTFVANIDVAKVQTSASSAPTTVPVFVWNFNDGQTQPIVLRGAAEQLSINFGGNAIPAGFSGAVSIEWTEE